MELHERFCDLLEPFWNHWLSLQCDWLSGVRFIHESHYIFCSKSHFFLSQWEWDSKTKQPIRFLGFFKLTNHITRKWKTKKSHCLANLAIKLNDFKMNLINWKFNFGLCNFGLKSYFKSNSLLARSILKSRIWFQTKLRSTQFNYHY